MDVNDWHGATDLTVVAYNQRIEEIADRMIAGDKLLLRHRGRRAIRVLATSELFVRAFESV